ncbi:UDP-galactopyranose mutase [Halogranum rubrum]|uniref:UDP-galactopyranose mutase n=1 Tax=Halogranum rubrum TaxID=553466 RepID=A0A1I4EE96_9EURY|nr:NAD(P)/FAD-dependent oxidoreductase [Halogranum rubrum]SFL03529.1 UDP-galactopyranose mutase [Halogranum rubrum]
MQDESVVVVGAGLAGLVTARRLAAADIDVTVYERRDGVGGRVRTERRGGYRLDRGFQVLFTAYPMVKAELDLDALDLRTFKPGATIARPGKRSVLSDPLRDPGALLSSVKNDEVSTTDKLRTLALRQHVTGQREDETFTGRDQSIRDYLKEWGFSRQYVENFVAPFYGGITLDRSLSTSKHVFEYTFRALSEGSIAVPAEGMQAIPEQLAGNAREAGAEIRLSEPVESIVDDGDGVTVTTGSETVAADAVVVATDPKRATELTEVEAIPTEARSCVTQHYRLPAGDAPDTGKRLLLNAGDESPNTVVNMTAVAPEYAPGDVDLLNATFLGEQVLDASAEELERRTRETLEGWYPDQSFDELERIETHRIPFAQFDQPPGVHETLPDTRAAGGRVYLAGDYTQWSSIQGAMRSGRNAAEALVIDLF